MTLFYKSTSAVGGGKLYYGSKEVKKLYLGEKLVYEAVKPLASGTVLSNNVVTLNTEDLVINTVYIPVLYVNNDWSNVSNSSRIAFSMRSGAVSYTEPISKKQLIEGNRQSLGNEKGYYIIRSAVNNPARIKVEIFYKGEFLCEKVAIQ